MLRSWVLHPRSVEGTQYENMLDQSCCRLESSLQLHTLLAFNPSWAFVWNGCLWHYDLVKCTRAQACHQAQILLMPATFHLAHSAPVNVRFAGYATKGDSAV